MAVPTLSERVTESFAAWEARGRGWQLADYPVWLEPSYRPFFLLPRHEVSHRHIDDGHRPTLLHGLVKFVDGLLSESRTERKEAPFEESAPFPAQSGGETVTRCLLVESDHAASVDTAARIICILASGFHPASFELLGHAGKVVAQIGCDAADAERIFTALADYLPEVALVGADDALMHTWVGSNPLIVDYGCAAEFFLPLATVPSLRLDPYIALVSALARAREGETLCFQILVQKTYNPWRGAILGAVTAADGKSIFTDAPEFPARAREKTESPLVAVVARLGAASGSVERSLDLIRGAHPFFDQFERQGSNNLMPLSNDGYDEKLHEGALLARMSFRTGMLLSVDELVGLIHIPDRSISNPALLRVERRTKVLPAVAKGRALILGENVHRGAREQVTLGAAERLAHTVIVGASGTGKSTLLLNMIRQDVERGDGVLVLDPHGDLIEDVMARVPRRRHEDVVLFDPSDEAHPIGFNVLDAASERERTLLASDLVAIFARFSSNWGDSMSTVLSNAVMAMLESKDGGTLLQLRRFLIDGDYRSEFLKTVVDDEVHFFWKKEWPLIGSRSIGPILTRLNIFLRPRLIRHIVGQRQPKLRLSEVIEGRKIFLAKLSQGFIGNENAYLLGSLILSRLLQLALARQGVDREARTPFWIYIDEAEHFVTPSLASLMTEGRKYGVAIAGAAFQMLSQLRASPQVEQAVLGNAYTRIIFRVGDDDARKLSEGFSYFEANDLRSLGRGEAIVRIGEATNDCNLRTLPLEALPESIAAENRAHILECSRAKYAVPLDTVTTELVKLQEAPESEPKVAEPAGILEQSTGGAQNHGTPAPSVKRTARHTTADRSKSVRPQPEVAVAGKGGREHKYVQHLIKRLASERGFRAEIEEPLSDGQVDVSLHRDGLSVACEISITTGVEHEIGNVCKCLAAGFAQVWLVIPNEKKRLSFKKTTAKHPEASSIRCIGVEDLPTMLDDMVAPLQSEQMVGGYKVKSSRRQVSVAESDQRRAVIAEVLARSAQKKRGET